jgi:hypothetical protein
MADWTPGRDGLSSGHYGVGINAIMSIQVRNRSALTEMFDTERPHTMATDGAKPS